MPRAITPSLLRPTLSPPTLLRLTLLLLTLLLLTQGCVSQPGQFVPASNDLATVRSTQQLTISFAGDVFEMLGVLETNATSTSLAVLSPTGILLFSIQQTPNTSHTEKNPDIPSHLDPARVLNDVQLVNWSSANLSQSLDQRLTLIETENIRSLYRDKKLIRTATFTPNARQWQHAVLQNHEQNYTLQITLLRTEIITGGHS
jgi:hypothetical protein